MEQDALAVRSRVEFEFREVVFPASGYILFGVRIMVVGYHAHTYACMDFGGLDEGERHSKRQGVVLLKQSI